SSRQYLPTSVCLSRHSNSCSLLRRPHLILCISCVRLRPPSSTLFPYTTLFRSRHPSGRVRLPAARRRDTSPAPPTAASSDHCWRDRKSTRLNSSHVKISYAVFCLKKKNKLDAKRRQERAK